MIVFQTDINISREKSSLYDGNLMRNSQTTSKLEMCIIAEMACAHEDNPDSAYRLVEIGSEAKQDAIQLQIFSVNNLVSPLTSNYGESKKLEISFLDWSGIIKSVQKSNIQVWANVFDESALEFALSESVDVIKLHSSDLSNPRMLDAVGDAGKPISIDIGGSTMDEIAQAISRLSKRGVNEIELIHGYQGYPMKIADARLGKIRSIKQLFGYPVGYQDHTDGGSDLAYILPIVAIGAGAQHIEKHITDDRTRIGIDYEAALDPEEL